MNYPRAQKTICPTHRHGHPSRLEAQYCLGLQAWLQDGKIKAFTWQYSVPLKINSRAWKTWKADFRVIENDNTISIHEAKGFNPSDDNFRLKLSIFFQNYPEIPVFVNWKRVYPSKSGYRILNLPPKRKRRWPNRLLGRRRA